MVLEGGNALSENMPALQAIDREIYVSCQDLIRTGMFMMLLILKNIDFIR